MKRAVIVVLLVGIAIGVLTPPDAVEQLAEWEVGVASLLVGLLE